MNNLTLGKKIQKLRKEKNMTQNDLAKLMSVTDKAVSKWERDISSPDISSLSNLANILDVTVNDLLDSTSNIKTSPVNDALINNVLKGVALGLSVACLVLNIIGKAKVEDSILFLSISLICIIIYTFNADK